MGIVNKIINSNLAKKITKEIISQNQLLIIVGETGVGKSTQFPQFISTNFMRGSINLFTTKKNRIAALTLAKCVATEMFVSLGKKVGYSFRFEDCSCNITIVKYTTEGLFLKKIISCKILSYEFFVFDEVHGRTVNFFYYIFFLNLISKKLYLIIRFNLI